MSEIMSHYTTVFLVCILVSVVSCTRPSPAGLENIKSEDPSRFAGKTLDEALNYLHERYGCYDNYEMVVDWEKYALGVCNFRYYDSADIYIVGFYFEPKEFQYLPEHLPKNRPNPIEFTFPLKLLKKEKVKKAVLEHMPLDWWVAKERRLDSLQEAIMYEVAKEKVLKDLGIQKPVQNQE